MSLYYVAMRRSTGTSASPPGTANSSAQRLPVNHRRHKVAPDQRKRVSTACNSCNVRRIKCSGERPCAQCRNGSRDCQYPQVIEKVSIPRTELEDLRSKVVRLEQCLEQAIPDEARRRDVLSRIAAGSLSSPTSTTTVQGNQQSDDEPTANEGRLLQDPDGVARYLGSTSGATFLDLIKEFMNKIFPLAWPASQHQNATFLSSLGSYQTHDSRPLNIHDLDPYCLPMKTEMTVMMAQLKYFVMDGSGDFPSGGIFYWGDLDPGFFDLRPVELSMDARAHGQLGLYHAAFAMTCQLEMPSETSNKTQRSECFFARARSVLGNPLDTHRSTVYDIAALAMMSLYLVEMNRRDAAYMYISLGMNIAVMHGVHRRWDLDEQGKRAFWTLYILDRWLSVLMGRPPSIQDDAIHLPEACDVQGFPPAMGLVAHVELSKIAGYIVCNAYGIAPSEHRITSTLAQIEHVLKRLSSWLAKLPSPLQMDGNELTNNDRACCELHMAYNQLLILTVRPIFFMAVKKAVAERFINHSWNLENYSQISHIRQCIDAARRNLRLGRWMRDLTQTRKLLSSTLHNIFNAAIILLLYRLLVDTLDEGDAMDVLFVIECYDAEARGHNNYAKDCASVLRDLTSLIQQLRNRNLENLSLDSSSSPTPNMAWQVQQQQQQPVATTAYDVGFILNPEVPVLPVSTPHTSSALYIELTTWMDQDDPLPLYNDYMI